MHWSYIIYYDIYNLLCILYQSHTGWVGTVRLVVSMQLSPLTF